MRTPYRNPFLLPLAALVLAASVAPGSASGAEGSGRKGTEADTPLVKVNDHLITQRELEAYLSFWYSTKGFREKLSSLPPRERKDLYDAAAGGALQDLVDRHLILAEARKLYFSREGVEAALEKFAQKDLEAQTEKMGASVAYRRFLLSRGVSSEEVKELRKSSLLISSYTQERVYSRIHISPGDLRRYYERHRDQFQQEGRIVFRQLWVDPEGRTIEEQRAKAHQILKQIREGADFAKMVNTHSLDRDTNPGGLYTASGFDSLPRWLREVLAPLEPGEVSDVQSAAGGCFIVKLEEVRQARRLSFEEAQPLIRRTLYNKRKTEAKRRLLTKLREKARIRYFPAGSAILHP